MREHSLLFSDIDPLLTNENQQTIINCFYQQLKEADSLDILVGYCSKASLEKLDELVMQQNIKNICLILGMYYFEGFPKTLYETIVQLNQKWMKLKIGEIRAIHLLKYHGKLYCFYKNQEPISAILGSANFSFLEEMGFRQKQYELASLFKDKTTLKEISFHIEDVKRKNISENISSLNKVRIVRDKNDALEELEKIEKIEDTKAQKFQSFRPENIFFLPLKVPSEKNKFNTDRSNYTKSNLNACYGRPREKGGAFRSWWEIQVIVSKKITSQKGYPRRGKWFYVITDDGYQFKAHTAGENGKQFAAVGNEQLLGKWIKGRLVSLGIVQPIKDVSLDIKREGMITQEMLMEYGGDKLVLINTGEKKLDENENLRDVWFLSFPRKVP